MVRAAPARPHPPLHARPAAARDRARVAGGVRPVPVRVAAGQARRPARGRRGARRRHRRARRVRGAGRGLGDGDPAGPDRGVYAGHARSAVPRRPGFVGAPGAAGARDRTGVRSGRFGRLRLRCSRGRGGGRRRCGWRRPRPMASYRRGLALFPIRRRWKIPRPRIGTPAGPGVRRHSLQARARTSQARAKSSCPRVETSRPRRSPPAPGASSRTSKPAERRSSTTFSPRPAPTGWIRPPPWAS